MEMRETGMDARGIRQDVTMPRWKVRQMIGTIMERLSSGEIEQSARMLQELAAVAPHEPVASELVQTARQSVLLMHKVFDIHEVRLEDALRWPEDISAPVLNYSLLLDARRKVETLDRLRADSRLRCAKMQKVAAQSAVNKLEGRVSDELLYELQDRVLDDGEVDLGMVRDGAYSVDFPELNMMSEGMVELNLGNWTRALTILEDCFGKLSAYEKEYEGLHVLTTSRMTAERMLRAARYICDRSRGGIINAEDVPAADAGADMTWKWVSGAIRNAGTTRNVMKNLSAITDLISDGRLLDASSFIEETRSLIHSIRGVYSQKARGRLNNELNAAEIALRRAVKESRDTILLGIIESIEESKNGGYSKPLALSRISECRALIALIGAIDEDVDTVKTALDEWANNLMLD